MKAHSDDYSNAKAAGWEFGISGPVHLTSVDWRTPDHCRSVVASLIQGVYILERERQQKRTGPKALAPAWWEFFHFQCIHILVDQVDSSIFGAIFENIYRISSHFHPMEPQNVPPRYVIVFRGTIMEPDTKRRDLYLDMQLAIHGLTRDSRYQIAFQAIHSIIANVDPRYAWLAGHSLGAAIALQAGKDMAKEGYYTRTYLFNPPFTSVPIEKINNPNLKDRIRFAKSMVTAGISLATKSNKDHNYSTKQCDQFTRLCSWFPYLFVNQNDPVCCEYIGYFENREKMKALGMERIGNIATKNSVMSLLSGALGRDGEALHLMPSALLTKNMVSVQQDLKVAHSIDQWWKPHSQWQHKLYKYAECDFIGTCSRV